MLIPCTPHPLTSDLRPLGIFRWPFGQVNSQAACKLLIATRNTSKDVRRIVLLSIMMSIYSERIVTLPREIENGDVSCPRSIPTARAQILQHTWNRYHDYWNVITNRGSSWVGFFMTIMAPCCVWCTPLWPSSSLFTSIFFPALQYGSEVLGSVLGPDK